MADGEKKNRETFRKKGVDTKEKVNISLSVLKKKRLQFTLLRRTEIEEISPLFFSLSGGSTFQR